MTRQQALAHNIFCVDTLPPVGAGILAKVACGFVDPDAGPTAAATGAGSGVGDRGGWIRKTGAERGVVVVVVYLVGAGKEGERAGRLVTGGGATEWDLI